MASLTGVSAADVLDTARQPFLVLDGEHRVVAANRAFCRSFHLTLPQLEGTPLETLNGGAWNTPALRTLLGDVLARQGEVGDVELDHEFGRAGRRILILNAREIRQEPGKPRLILIAIEDVTVRRASEHIAQQANAELRRSNRELQEFAAVTSHDLQEPLRKIQAFGDVLQRQLGPRLDDESLATLNRIKNAAARMSALINDLLTYARLGNVMPALSAVKLNEVVDEVLVDLDSRISAADARITVDDLPTLMVDRGQMRQLFTNLLVNALKFRRPGVIPDITVTASRRDDTHWAITIADNGLGFDRDYASRIFGMFQRLHGTAHEGTGIGLSLCRRIVERHGGSISADGAPGQGAKFTMVFPREAI